ncbi:unnamed protein product [Rotaria sp. Silwood2]|nr:unnamed protein product [Rotaria sp. Silwood2]
MRMILRFANPVSFISCFGGLILFTSIIPIFLIHQKSSSSVISSSNPFSTEFNMNYLLTDIDFSAMSITADDMALIFNEFKDQAYSLNRNGLIITSMKKVNTTTERNHLKHVIPCDKSNTAMEILLIMRVRLQYPNNFICRSSICAKNYFMIIHNKLQTISAFTVKRQNGFKMKFSLCSIENLICTFMPTSRISRFGLSK